MLELLAERKLCPRCRAPNVPDRTKCIECGMALPQTITPAAFAAAAPDETEETMAEPARPEPRAERVVPQGVIPKRVVPERTRPERGRAESETPAAGLMRVVGWGAMIAGLLLAGLLIGTTFLYGGDLARAGALGAGALAGGIVLGALFLGFAANLELLAQIRSRLDTRQGPSA